MSRRVVVTGMGAMTPLGCEVGEFWRALIEGKSGVSLTTQISTEGLTTKIGAEVRDFHPENFFERKEIRRMDRFVQFAAAAAINALKDSGLTINEENAERVGVIIGSGIGGIQTIEDQCRNMFEKGPGRVSPFFIPMMIPNMAAGQVSILTGARGPNWSAVTACASGSHAIGEAFKIIQRGQADVIISGGTEAPITRLTYAGFASAGALSKRNDHPEKASRPFDAERDGFIIAEGSGILILEELSAAKKRGAKIYGEILGYGASGDAYHITAPHPEALGGILAMKMAIEDAGVSPDSIDYINAHGTSTHFNDKLETLAIKQVFGDYAYQLPVSSTKSMTGHLLGAAGAVEAIACLLALDEGIIPPTINYEYPDPECDLDYVPNKAREKSIKLALSNSLGFGGHNACLLFGRYDG
ncbi:MAG TPA: beta-ketoacyl-ACP synthase II [Bacillota bacterium]|nr:beta-ketoacyl-ACP synthase II [Bacillota bacterium]